YLLDCSFYKTLAGFEVDLLFVLRNNEHFGNATGDDCNMITIFVDAGDVLGWWGKKCKRSRHVNDVIANNQLYSQTDLSCRWSSPEPSKLLKCHGCYSCTNKQTNNKRNCCKMTYQVAPKWRPEYNIGCGQIPYWFKTMNQATGI